MADLKVALKRAGHQFGSVVDPSDVEALLAPLALGAPQSDAALEEAVDDTDDRPSGRQEEPGPAPDQRAS